MPSAPSAAFPLAPLTGVPGFVPAGAGVAGFVPAGAGVAGFVPGAGAGVAGFVPGPGAGVAGFVPAAGAGVPGFVPPAGVPRFEAGPGVPAGLALLSAGEPVETRLLVP